MINSVQRKLSRTTEVNLLHSDMSSRGALNNLTNQALNSGNSSGVGQNVRKVSSDGGSREGMKINTENIPSLDAFSSKDMALRSAPPTSMPSNVTGKSSGFTFSDK